MLLQAPQITMWRLQTQNIHILKQSHCLNRNISRSCYDLMKTYPGSEVPLQRKPTNQSEERELCLARSYCVRLFRFGAPGFGFGTSDAG